jgi:hypothetical protein
VTSVNVAPATSDPQTRVPREGSPAWVGNRPTGDGGPGPKLAGPVTPPIPTTSSP